MKSDDGDTNQLTAGVQDNSVANNSRQPHLMGTQLVTDANDDREDHAHDSIIDNKLLRDVNNDDASRCFTTVKRAGVDSIV